MLAYILDQYWLVVLALEKQSGACHTWMTKRAPRAKTPSIITLGIANLLSSPLGVENLCRPTDSLLVLPLP